MINLLTKNPNKIQKLRKMCREHTLSEKVGNKILQAELRHRKNANSTNQVKLFSEKTDAPLLEKKL